jgi:hypothetical protein
VAGVIDLDMEPKAKISLKVMKIAYAGLEEKIIDERILSKFKVL